MEPSGWTFWFFGRPVILVVMLILLGCLRAEAQTVVSVQEGSIFHFGEDFFKSLRRVAVTNQDGSGPGFVALFQLRENRWNKMRLDLSKPYCTVHLREPMATPLVRPLKVTKVSRHAAYPTGFFGSVWEFDDSQIAALGCFRMAMQGKIARPLGLKDVQEVLGTKITLQKERSDSF